MFTGSLMFKFKTIPATALIALGIASSVSVANIPASYEVIDLGALPSFGAAPQQSSGFSLNEAGVIVGSSVGDFTYTTEVNGVVTTQHANVHQAVRFFDDGADPVTIIPESINTTLSAAQRGSFSLGVDSAGTVVGYRFNEEVFETYTLNTETEECEASDTTSIRARAIYDNGNYNELTPFVREGEALDPNITEYLETVAHDISGNWLVGSALVITEKDDCNDFITLENRGFIFDTITEEKTFIELLSQQHNKGNITSINPSGTYVGVSGLFLPDRFPRYQQGKAFIGTTNTSILEVEGLDVENINLLWDINDNGSYAVGSSDYQAFYYDINTQESIAIGFLKENFDFSEAFSINNDNLVVGVSQSSSTPLSFKPFIFDIDSETSSLIDLNTLIDCDSGWNLAEVREINNDGWIIGSGTVSVEQIDGTFEGEIRAFLLKPRTTEANQSCETTEVVETGGSINGIILLFLSSLFVYRRFSN